MNLKEAELVVISDETYNLCPGGNGGFGYINDNSLNNKNKDYSKLSSTLKGRKNISASKRMKYLHENNLLEYNKTKGTTGFKFTDETKEKMSKSASGLKSSQFGSMWITNGTENKKIKSIDSIPEGWYKGRKIK